MIFKLMAVLGVLALTSCDSTQRALQSATGDDPAASCASPETYRSISKIVLDRMGDGKSFQTVGDVTKRIRYENPVLETIDASTGVKHCSADLVIPDALTFMIEHVETTLRFRKSGDALIIPIEYQIARAADSGATVLRLDDDGAVGKFVYAFGSDYGSRITREVDESEARRARELPQDETANAADAIPRAADSDARAEPIDTHDEATDHNRQ